MDAAHHAALHQVTEQRPKIDETSVEIFVKNARIHSVFASYEV
jgi:hypothetical protein